MQQRRPRLGDILDDYCPRERRLTNHVVVAMVDEDVKQTRCTTCDAEHEYKQGKAPSPRRKKTGALSPDVPDSGRPRPATASAAVPTDDAETDESPDAIEPVPADTPTAPVETTLTAAAEGETAGDELDAEADERSVDDEGPVHRRLIRATLPRPEGHVPERKEPDFTMRQPTGREFNGNNRNGHRGRGHRPMRQAQGQPGNETRFGGPRHGGGAPRHGAGQGQGQGQGQRQGNRPGQPSQRGGGRPGGGQPGGQNRGPGRKRGR